jgi:hypothetical protein
MQQPRTSTRRDVGEPIDALKRRAVRRARQALGHFGSGVAHVVLRPRGASRCRRFVVALTFGSARVEEVAA